jgi:hypothetical protein
MSAFMFQTVFLISQNNAYREEEFADACGRTDNTTM